LPLSCQHSRRTCPRPTLLVPPRRPAERTWPWTLDAARAGSKDKLLAGGEQADFLLAGAERCLVLLPERLKQPMFNAQHVSRRCVWRAQEVGLELDKEWAWVGEERCHAWSFGTRCRWRMTSVARTSARASRTGVGGRSDNVFFFHPKRPTTSSSSQSTTSSTFSALPQADRRWAHQGGRGHARADHLGPPPAGAARPPPSSMRQADRQRREPLVLVEEEHELDRDHREQWDEERTRVTSVFNHSGRSRRCLTITAMSSSTKFRRPHSGGCTARASLIRAPGCICSPRAHRCGPPAAARPRR